MSLAQTFLGQLSYPLHLSNGVQVSNLNFNAYNKYVERQQKIFRELSSSAINPNDNVSLGKVADFIRRHNQRDQAATYVSTLSGNTNSIACQATLDLVTRLMLMVEVGCLEKPSGFMHQTGPRPLLLWTESSLTSLTTKHFPTSGHQDCSGQLLGQAFDAWSLENVAGIKMEFTDNLADHLRLTNSNTQLYIFHHVAYLEQQRHNSTGQRHILPDGLAEETLKTLAVLFPQSDHWGSSRSSRKKQVWFDRLCAHSSCAIDPQLTWCGTPTVEGRQLANFSFWKDRLMIIKEEYDYSTPDSFSQWWYDRRNGVQWHHFWVAMLVLGLTAIFGLIQCILAAIQVYKAYYPS